MDGCFLLSGLERKLLCGDGAAGSHRGAERTEEEQRHQQLQRQSHIITAADHILCTRCNPSSLTKEFHHRRAIVTV